MLNVFIDLEAAPAHGAAWLDFCALRGVRDDETPQQVSELRERSSLTGLAQLLTIGVAVGVDGPIECLHPEGEEPDDLALIEQLRQWLGTHVGRSRFRLVGWRLNDYDVPLLAQKALVAGHPKLARALTGGALAKPWERPVLDLHAAWPSPEAERFGRDGLARGMTTQQEVCRRLGIPVQDGPLGADMAECLERGDWPAIIAHQVEDVRQLQALYRRLEGAL